MIKPIAYVSDLSPLMVEEYRRYGWTDEEIIENLSDAINCLNSHFFSVELDPDVPLDVIFADAGA